MCSYIHSSVTQQMHAHAFPHQVARQLQIAEVLSTESDEPNKGLNNMTENLIHA